MQSAVPHVLATLDRVHSPGRAAQAVAEARAAGFDQVSLDLIYGTPGESGADWETSLDAALAAAPDHVSAYALIVEPGTRLAARVRRGELPMPDEDDLADKYLAAEARLTAAGHTAYEVSNWALRPAARCRHNLAYWRGDHWWGVGPGAHSHVGGVRWWNVKHPERVRRTARRGPLAGVRPRGADRRGAADRTGAARAPAGRRTAAGRADRDRVQAGARSGRPGAGGGRRRAADADAGGRLLADGVVRDLLD